MDAPVCLQPKAVHFAARNDLPECRQDTAEHDEYRPACRLASLLAWRMIWALFMQSRRVWNKEQWLYPEGALAWTQLEFGHRCQQSGVGMYNVMCSIAVTKSRAKHTCLARRIRPRRCASCLRDPAWLLIWISTFASGISMELSPTLDRKTVLICNHQIMVRPQRQEQMSSSLHEAGHSEAWNNISKACLQLQTISNPRPCTEFLHMLQSDKSHHAILM